MSTPYSNFDLLLGASRSHILNYFGRPDKNYSSVLIFKREVGTLAVVAQPKFYEGKQLDEVCAFVLYDTKGNLLYAKGVQPLHEDQIATAETMQTAEAILTTFGDTHFDIGSGMHNYGYFTERGELFLIGNLSGQSHCRRIPV